MHEMLVENQVDTLENADAHTGCSTRSGEFADRLAVIRSYRFLWRPRARSGDPARRRGARRNEVHCPSHHD